MFPRRFCAQASTTARCKSQGLNMARPVLLHMSGRGISAIGVRLHSNKQKVISCERDHHIPARVHSYSSSLTRTRLVKFWEFARLARTARRDSSRVGNRREKGAAGPFAAGYDGISSPKMPYHGEGGQAMKHIYEYIRYILS